MKLKQQAIESMGDERVESCAAPVGNRARCHAGLVDLIEKEPEPLVRAVLGHRLFGYIHPYPDGNGRMARFVMNALLASGGYPWTVIRVEDRDAYLASLESVSVRQEIAPFAGFVGQCDKWSLKQAA